MGGLLNRARTTRLWSHPIFLVFAALVGVGLMVGAPLVAQDHPEPGQATEPGTEEHGAVEHGASTFPPWSGSWPPPWKASRSTTWLTPRTLPPGSS